MGIIWLLIVVALVIIGDHIRYWRQTDYFIEISESFADMYNVVLKAMKEGKNATYESSYFQITIDDADYKKFWNYIFESIREVIQAYEQIDKRYFEEMDDETHKHIEQLNETVKKINNIARTEAWKWGIDVHSK